MIPEFQIELANATNLLDFLRENHPESIREYHGNFVSVDHDSLVIFEDGYYRYSNGESGTSVYFLFKYLGYDFKQAVNALLAFKSSVQRTRKPIERLKWTERTFYRPIQNIMAQGDIQDYLVGQRKLDHDMIARLCRDGKIYAALIDGEGTKYVCFANSENDFYILRNTETEGIQKYIVDKRSYGFWYFATSGRESVGDLFTYYANNKKPTFPVHLPIYICESPIDAISLYQLTGCEGIYTAMGGLKVNTLERIIKAFPFYEDDEISYDREIIIAVDNDSAGDRFADKFEYKRIVPNKKDWNEDLIKTHP